jgi:hypothetical protein
MFVSIPMNSVGRHYHRLRERNKRGV